MGTQRIIQGTVVSNRMQKTVVVSVERKKKHRLYHKVVSVTDRYQAHDEHDDCHLGDLVRIAECRPMSRHKRWRVVEVLLRGDVAEVAPQAIGREIETTTQASARASASSEGTLPVEDDETPPAQDEEEHS